MTREKTISALIVALTFLVCIQTKEGQAQNDFPPSIPWKDPFHCGPVTAAAQPMSGGGAPQAATPPQPNIFDELSACGLSLQNTINDNPAPLGGSSPQGAAFTQSDTNGTSGFKSQFALIYTSQNFYESELEDNFYYLISSVDANLNSSSAASERTSYLNVRAEVGGYLGKDVLNSKGDLTGVNALLWRAGPVFETTQDTAVQNGLFEIAALPLTFGPSSLSPITLGQYTDFFETPIRYRLQPYFTLQAGRNTTGLDLSREFDPMRLRLITEPILEFQVADPGKVFGLGLSAIGLTLDDAFTVNPLEGKTIVINKVPETSPMTHNLFTIGFNLGIGKLTFGPSYSIGQTPPLYKQSHTISVGLKLAFGSGTLHAPGAPASAAQ